jgi:hypothetical protein
MTLVLNDRVLETCTSPGTGSCTLLGATTGFRTFSAGVGNGNTCYYTIADQNGGNWEVGLGTYTSSSNSLARTTVLSSSNSGSLVNFNSGTQNVFVTYPAEKSVYLDASGNIVTSGNLTVTGGLYAQGAFSGTYSDGIVVDYTSGLGRISVGSSDGLSIYNGGVGGTALLNLDSSGNLGLGTATSAWYSTVKAFQLGLGGALFAKTNVNNEIGVFANTYVNTSGSTIYINTDKATGYEQSGGAHYWYLAGSGTAGSAISFTQAMTLDASGRLGLGVTSPTVEAQIYAPSLARVQVQNSTSGSGQTDGFQFAISGSDGYLWNFENGAAIFGTNNTERARIDSSGNFGIGTTANASAILDAQSTTKGVRFPNMTSTQKNAISSPAAGLVVFDTTLAKLCVYSGAAWQTITSI